MDIKLLIEQIADGDPGAWSMIVDRYSKGIYNLALNFAGNADDAADITQDIFIKLFSNIHKFTPEGNFNAWLMRMARNQCIDFWRKNRKNRNMLQLDEEIRLDDRDEEQHMIDHIDVQKLRRHINRLDPELRVLLIMRDVQNHSYQEIAASLDLPLGTVKSRINRGRIKLARLFRQGDEDGL
ncbi:MAG: RNA polymerase sigma factor [Acidobacteriota bacterium]|jgi:RNA polymerase sigma-70 factor (ECF subfamily)|nr:RNA polymerase sigma factor [Acidobacteriota bacterium]